MTAAISLLVVEDEPLLRLDMVDFLKDEALRYGRRTTRPRR